MNDSILTSIKKLLGIDESYKQFDADIVMHINSAFSILNQLAVGPSGSFVIADDTTVWADYETRIDLSLLKTYIYLRVKLMFDPPANSFLVNSIDRQITEFEWRLNVQAEHPV